MFSGSIPALVTPFEDRGDHVGGAFDEGRFRDFVEWQIEQGSSALVACGTTGEAATMPKDEHFHVVRVCVDQANGRVPVIEDDGFVLWESNAIVRYLLARHAVNTPWYPADLQARASAEKWMDWTTSSFAGPFRTVFWGVLRTPADQQDWPAIQAAVKECEALLAMADQALASQPYLSGDEIGMGDIPLGSFIYAWFEMPIERSPKPHLQAWYARLQERPAYRKAVMTALT